MRLDRIIVRVQSGILALFLAAEVIFALLNHASVFETRTAQLPGTIYTGPVIGMIFIVAAVALLLMLLVDVIGAAVRTRLEGRGGASVVLGETGVTSVRVDEETSQKIEALREELSDQIVALGKLIEDRFPRKATAGRSNSHT